MTTKRIVLLALGGMMLISFLILFSIGSWGISTYNGYISNRQEATTAWSQVETQYQRRFDLIPSLVEATKGTLRQEQAVFIAIAEARKGYAGTAPASSSRIKATSMLDSALSRLLIVIENYPELKSNRTIHDLMDEIAGTENRINVARYRYNDVVKIYDTSLEQFPGRFIASFFHFEAKPYYESVKGSEIAPKINLEIK